MHTRIEPVPKNKWNYKARVDLGEGYIKYVQECNEQVLASGNTDLKAEPEFVWERKNQPNPCNLLTNLR